MGIVPPEHMFLTVSCKHNQTITELDSSLTRKRSIFQAHLFFVITESWR